MKTYNVRQENFKAFTKQFAFFAFFVTLLLTSACSSLVGRYSNPPPRPAPPFGIEPASAPDVMSSPPPPLPRVVVPASPPPLTATELEVPPPVQQNPEKKNAPGYHLVPVHYASDRLWKGGKYGTEKDQSADHVTYGVVSVSIPDNRKPGEIPIQPWYSLFGEQPKKWVYVKDIIHLSQEFFFESLKISLGKIPERRLAFIYVHGYNNSFDDAARRTAQISVDLDLPIVPVFYTWPSQESAMPQKYHADEETVTWSQPHLMKFFEDFADKSSATDIFVIAHSLGSRPTTGALSELIKRRPELLGRYKSIILAAPDINVDIFNDIIAPAFSALKIPSTIYMSRNDKALLFSSKEHSGFRIGEGREPIKEIPGFDVVDVSSVNTNFMGHDYISSNKKLLTDVAKILKEGSSPATRGLKGRPGVPFIYWELIP